MSHVSKAFIPVTDPPNVIKRPTRALPEGQSAMKFVHFEFRNTFASHRSGSSMQQLHPTDLVCSCQPVSNYRCSPSSSLSKVCPKLNGPAGMQILPTGSQCTYVSGTLVSKEGSHQAAGESSALICKDLAAFPYILAGSQIPSIMKKSHTPHTHNPLNLSSLQPMSQLA